MTLYVYFVSFVLNILFIYRKFKGRRGYLPFLVLKTLIFILFFNLLFEIFKRSMGFLYIDERSIFKVYIVGIVLYVLTRRYICLSLSFLISYVIFYLFGVHLSVRDIIFIIGFNHLCEGVFILFSRDMRGCMYLPLFLHSYAFIFFIFYNRGWREVEYRNFISGVFVFTYGIIILFSLRVGYAFDFIMVTFTYVLHEIMIFLEGKLLNKIDNILNFIK